jgi:hypothetical protein
MKSRNKIAAAIVLLVFFLTSCAMFQTAKDQPFTTWSPKKKLTYAINVYSTEYDKYVQAAMRPDLTDAQRDYLKVKRNVLIGLDNIIGLLIPFADSTQPFPADLEQQLIEWLSRLGYTPM